jgi:hypothetical protein
VEWNPLDKTSIFPFGDRATTRAPSNQSPRTKEPGLQAVGGLALAGTWVSTTGASTGAAAKLAKQSAAPSKGSVRKGLLVTLALKRLSEESCAEAIPPQKGANSLLYKRLSLNGQENCASDRPQDRDIFEMGSMSARNQGHAWPRPKTECTAREQRSLTEAQSRYRTRILSALAWTQ